jgi:hypothetical protein
MVRETRKVEWKSILVWSMICDGMNPFRVPELSDKEKRIDEINTEKVTNEFELPTLLDNDARLSDNS